MTGSEAARAGGEASVVILKAEGARNRGLRPSRQWRGEAAPEETKALSQAAPAWLHSPFLPRRPSVSSTCSGVMGMRVTRAPIAWPTAQATAAAAAVQGGSPMPFAP